MVFSILDYNSYRCHHGFFRRVLRILPILQCRLRELYGFARVLLGNGEGFHTAHILAHSDAYVSPCVNAKVHTFEVDIIVGHTPAEKAVSA